MKSKIWPYVIGCAILVTLPVASALGAPPTVRASITPVFQVTSATFSNGGTLPLSMLGSKCPSPVANPVGGGNQSPELSWTNVPRGTQSFVVIAYDVTASFTYWGMYNIHTPAVAVGLPENAGVPGSPFGEQIANDLKDQRYDGPCPQPQPGPLHELVFTVYALNTELILPPTSFPGFTQNAEWLYRLLIDAGRGGHILATASIGGYFPGGS